RAPPSLQALQSADPAPPDAAVAGWEHRPWRAFRQPLVHCNCRDRGVPEPVEPVVGGHPDVAFAIFEEAPDVVAGEAVGSRKPVDPAAMDANEAPVEGADPQRAI